MARVTVTVPPGGVNFWVLCKRFPTACPKRLQSPRTQTGSCGNCSARRMPTEPRIPSIVLRCFAHNRRQIAGLFINFNLPGGDPRNVEQVVSKMRHSSNLPLDD